jgi:hypothetical protein
MMSPFHPALWLYRTLLNQSPLVFLKLSLPLGLFQKRYQYWKSIQLLNICETICHSFFFPDIQASGCGSESKCGKRWKEPLITHQIEYSN